MTLPTEAFDETGRRKTRQVSNEPCRVLSARGPVKIIFRLIFVACMALLCRCAYGADSKVLDAATRAKVKDLVRQLHEAEAELEDLVRKAEEENPELPRYKKKHKEITEWYWGKRLEGSSELASALYGSDPDKKDERLRVYEQAKANVFLMYFLEPSESPEKEDLLKWWFSVEGSKNRFAEGFGMTIIDPNNFFEEMKAFLKKNRPLFEKQISDWRQKYDFITDFVWDRAYKSATGEFKMHALDMAIYKLTPENVRDAEKRVGQITKELERTWPDWDEIYKEFIASVDRIVEEESEAMLSGGNSIAKASTKSIEQITQVAANNGSPKPQADNLQPQETPKQKWWWYGILVVGAILGSLALVKCIRKKLC